MTAKSKGLVAKFEVRRIDAEAQARHADCRAFVLDPEHDPIALYALEMYARRARLSGWFNLADDLDKWTIDIRERQRANP